MAVGRWDWRTGHEPGDIISRDIGERGLRVAGWRVLNPFVSAVEIKRSVTVFGKHHHAGVVGDRGGEKLRRERRYRHPVGVGRIPGQRD